jgi:hypothetical protein
MGEDEIPINLNRADDEFKDQTEMALKNGGRRRRERQAERLKKIGWLRWPKVESKKKKTRQRVNLPIPRIAKGARLQQTSGQMF